MNREIKEKIKNIKTLDECKLFLMGELKKYNVLCNINYTDYNCENLYKNIKIYKYSETDFIVVITEIDGLKPKKIIVSFLNEAPPMPHKLFPLTSMFLRKAQWFEFEN